MALALPLASFAAYSDVTLTTSAKLSVGGVTLTVAGTSAVVQSITVNALTFSAVLLPNSVLAVSSASRNVIATDAPSANITGNQCTSDASTLTLSSSSGSALTVVVTPNSSATCTGSASNASGTASSNGAPSGGGGGGSYIAPVAAKTTVVAPKVSTTATISSSASTQAYTQGYAMPAHVFVKALAVGNVNSEVKILQQILNADADTKVAATGAGSPGKESTTFGPATKSALQKFQVKYKIAKPGEQGYGVLGPKTRAKLSEISGTKVTSSGTVAPSQTKTDLAKQISDTLKQIQDLQAKIKASQKP